MARSNIRQAQIRQKRNYDQDAVHLHPYKGDQVLVSVKVIPRGGVGKLLRLWRGPFAVKHSRHGGRWYILDNEMIVHYERLKPYVPRVTDMEVAPPNDDDYQPVPDDPQETSLQEEIPPVDDVSHHGTFDAETESEFSFSPPDGAQIPTSDRVLRPRKPVDYFKIENPDEFQLFMIRPTKGDAPQSRGRPRHLTRHGYGRRCEVMESVDKVIDWMD